jgi:hypothetical protein
VVDGEGVSVDLEVDDEVYEEQGATARFWAGLAVLGAASCGGCRRTEGLQAPAARTRSLSLIRCKETTSEGMRGCAPKREKERVKKWRLLLPESTRNLQEIAAVDDPQV